MSTAGTAVAVGGQMVRTLLLASLLAAAVGCADEDSSPNSACLAAREHAVDLHLPDSPALAGLEEGEREQHRRAMRAALGQDFLAACEASGPAWSACILDARSAAQAAGCGGGAR